MKRWQNIWTKSKRTAVFFRENVPNISTFDFYTQEKQTNYSTFSSNIFHLVHDDHLDHYDHLDHDDDLNNDDHRIWKEVGGWVNNESLLSSVTDQCRYRAASHCSHCSHCFHWRPLKVEIHRCTVSIDSFHSKSIIEIPNNYLIFTVIT